MPIIVTVKRGQHPEMWTTVKDTAFITLEEARFAAMRAAIPGTSLERLAAGTVPEDGGTIGPLRDGTLIEVKPLPWFKLAIAAGMLPAWQQGADTPWVEKTKCEILEAYNAQESAHAS